MEEKVVIINTYKLEKLLEESLEEVFKQVEEELKIIIGILYQNI